MSASLLEGRNENAQKKDLLPTPKAGFTHPEVTRVSLVKVESLFCFNPNTLIN